MKLQAEVRIIDIPLTNTAKDTVQAKGRFKSAGCHPVVSLGGDGTNRAIVGADSDIDLVLISTGTNNVFPALMEPTLGGMVAGLNALGKTADMPESLRPRTKFLYLQTPMGADIELIDAVLLRNDHVGNMLPLDGDHLGRMLLTRAEPNSVGMSPINGFIDPVYAENNWGLWLEKGGQGQRIRAPLYLDHSREVIVRRVQRTAFDETHTFHGPAVIALDGDRDHGRQEGDTASVTLRRDGPRILEVEGIMRWAVGAGIMRGAVNAGP